MYEVCGLEKKVFKKGKITIRQANRNGLLNGKPKQAISINLGE